MQKCDVDTYLPMRWVWKLVKGKKKRILEPLIPNLLFAYASQDVLDSCMKAISTLPCLSYYYDHFNTLPGGKNPPLTVGYWDMMNFIRLTSVDNEHICVVTPQQCHYKDGDWVQVVKGDFEGVIGKVAGDRAATCGGKAGWRLSCCYRLCTEQLYRKDPKQGQ